MPNGRNQSTRKGAAKKRAPGGKRAAKKRAPAKNTAAKKRAPAKKAAAKKRAATKKTARRKRGAGRRWRQRIPSQPFLDEQMYGDTVRNNRRRRGRRTVGREAVAEASEAIKSRAPMPYSRLPEEVRQSTDSLKPRDKRTHGAKYSLLYFPGSIRRPHCADRFGYMSTSDTRDATALAMNPTNRALLEALGAAMAAPGRDAPATDSTIDAGFTYVGQFVDHDITLDISSSLDIATDAETINNMRTPRLDLDSIYGQGPVLSPFQYAMPGPGEEPTAIRMQMGTNTNTGPGGPDGGAGPGGMVVHDDRDVPRTLPPSQTAIIGDPRNDENLIVVQFHAAMLEFHNRVVESLVTAGFSGDIFLEAQRQVRHHYQWAVVHDFLATICGTDAMDDAMATVTVDPDDEFRMPVEFSVAAYRYGHSQIRDQYWINHNFPFATLGQVFQFNRNPNLPVFSNWVVDFNAFFPTGVTVPIFNKARRIDTGIANGLDSLPGASGLMARLATRNLLRGMALGLPSGQGMAAELGETALTGAELAQGLPDTERDALEAGGGVLLERTPLWYYVLREAVVHHEGNQLGPVGGRIVAETFARMLKGDEESYVNQIDEFVPILPSATPDDFTFTDLVVFSGVTQP